MKLVYWLSVFIFKLFTKIYFRGKCLGIENIPEKGPFIGAINHSSNMDVVVTSLVIKHWIRTMGKDSLFKIPILKQWMKASGVFPVKRNASDEQAFNYALELLKHGEILFMAPEGTRKKTKGETRRPRTGFIRLAQMAQCPIVPISIFGADKALPPGAFFPLPHRVIIKVGKPIYLEKVEVCLENKDILQNQADYVMAVIYQMQKEAAGLVTGL